MSNMKVIIKDRNDAECSATATIINARLSFFANPTVLQEVEFKGEKTGRWRYEGQFHLDKDAEGAKELVDMLFAFRSTQSTTMEQAKLILKDGDAPENQKTKGGVDISKSNSGTWIVSANRQPSQEIGTLISKKAYKEDDDIPEGWKPYALTTPRPFIAKILSSPDEIGGNDIAHIVISIYKIKGVRAVQIGWESMQLVKHVGKNNRGSVEDFADLPDTEDETQADNETQVDSESENF